MATKPQMNDAATRLLALRRGIIAELWQNARYRSLVEELKTRRPVVPYWKPAHVNNKGILVPDNTSEMQAASAAQKWHDVIMAIINPESYPKEIE